MKVLFVLGQVRFVTNERYFHLFDGITSKGLSASLFYSGNSLLYANLLLEPGASQTDPSALHLAKQFQTEMGGSRYCSQRWGEK